MKKVRTEDISKYGVRFVTNEACGIGMRSLYGVTEEAWPLVKDFFGIHGAMPYPFVTGDYSTFMMPNAFVHLLLMYLIFAIDKPGELLYVPRQLIAQGNFTVDEMIYVKEGPEDGVYYEKLEWMQKHNVDGRIYWISGNAKDGLRNRHWFTGMVG